MRILGVVILVVGIVLLFFGISSTQHVSDEVTKAVSGRYTDQTMWYIIGGAVLIVIGLFVARKRS